MRYAPYGLFGLFVLQSVLLAVEVYLLTNDPGNGLKIGTTVFVACMWVFCLGLLLRRA